MVGLGRGKSLRAATPSTLLVNEHTIVKLGLLAGALAVGSFLILGTTRLVVGFDTAQTVAAPFFAGGFVLAVVVSALSVLAKLGVISVDEG